MPINLSGHKTNGIVSEGVVGENVTKYDVLYMKSDGKYWKADASAEGTMPVSVLALESKNADEVCELLLFGFVTNASWSMTVGGLIYVSTTAGEITQIAPSGLGEQVQVIGIAMATDTILFNPSYECVEIS